MLGLLLAAQAAAWATRPVARPPSPVVVERVPLRIGEWRGRDLGPLERGTLEMLQPDDYLNREYVSAHGLPAYLAVIYGHRKTTFHSPGFCLLGGGWNIVEKSRLQLATAGRSRIEVNRFLLVRGDQQAVVLYYYLQGKRSSASWVTHQLYLVMDRARQRSSAGALVRLTVPVVSDAATATGQGADLLARLAPHVGEAIRP